ncbi:MAG: NUDIX hydrolase N-terminal domain-containing protein [Clostridiales bacterium]|nr:NUDIX hydrolase N-terminal domain-containing protein [Clostridiales bacterium]
MSELTDIARRLQGIASGGILYTRDKFDKERFEEIMDISARLLELGSDVKKETALEIFEGNDGYPTPKSDVRAAVFNDRDEILLVRDLDGKWALPGGWCDFDRTVFENAVKECREEAGIEVEAEKLVAVHFHRKRNNPKSFFSSNKFFVVCRFIKGEFKENIETSEAKYFPVDKIPEDINTHKNNLDQIRLCYKAYLTDPWIPEVD